MAARSAGADAMGAGDLSRRQRRGQAGRRHYPQSGARGLDGGDRPARTGLVLHRADRRSGGAGRVRRAPKPRADDQGRPCDLRRQAASGSVRHLSFAPHLRHGPALVRAPRRCSRS
jgi:hypothetical protein